MDDAFWPPDEFDIAGVLRAALTPETTPMADETEREALIGKSAEAMADADYWAKLSAEEKRHPQNVRFYRAMAAVVIDVALAAGYVSPSRHRAGRCPIGLDDSPTLCSAGCCASCVAWRAYVQEMEARHRVEVEAALVEARTACLSADKDAATAERDAAVAAYDKLRAMWESLQAQLGEKWDCVECPHAAALAQREAECARLRAGLEIIRDDPELYIEDAVQVAGDTLSPIPADLEKDND